MLPGPTVARMEPSRQIHRAAHSARAGVLRRRTNPTQAAAAEALIRVAPTNMAWAPEPRTR